MSIRPVDLQVMLPRASEVTRANHLENGRPEAQQSHFSQQLQKQTETEQRQVIKSNKTEKRQVDRDGSNKQKQEQQNKKKKGNSKDESPYENKGMIDIRI